MKSVLYYNIIVSAHTYGSSRYCSLALSQFDSLQAAKSEWSTGL